MAAQAFYPQEKKKQNKATPHQCPAYWRGNLGRAEDQRRESGHKQDGAPMVSTAGGTGLLSLALQETKCDEVGDHPEDHCDQKEGAPSRMDREDASDERSQCQSRIDRGYRDAEHLPPLLCRE